MGLKKYVIVKYASRGYHKFHFARDPKITGVAGSQSAHFTYSGKIAGLEPFYIDLEQANAACERINKINPSGGYAVCEVVHQEFVE